MVYLLLLFSLLVSLLAGMIVHLIFKKPLQNILKGLFPEEIYEGWYRYIIFAIYIVGISSGVKIWKINEYIENAAELTKTKFFISIYDSLIQAFMGTVWLLFVFFMFTMIAYVIVRLVERKKEG